MDLTLLPQKELRIYNLIYVSESCSRPTKINMIGTSDQAPQLRWL